MHISTLEIFKQPLPRTYLLRRAKHRNNGYGDKQKDQSGRQRHAGLFGNGSAIIPIKRAGGH